MFIKSLSVIFKHEFNRIVCSLLHYFHQLHFQIEDEAYQSELGFSMGNLGKKSAGKLRAPVADSKTKARVSKTLQVSPVVLTVNRALMKLLAGSD